MGALGVFAGVSVGAVCLCGLYSGLDIKYGEKGFICWSAFCLLAVTLGGGAARGAVAAAFLGAGKLGGLEPFAVLLVSLLATKTLYSGFFGKAEDDLQVSRKPYEEEIRELLFQNDPSRLHLVDAELRRYKGREKQLLREYEAEFSPAPAPMTAGRLGFGQDAGRGGDGGGGSYGTRPDQSARQRGVVELAQEAEARRVEATLQASLDRIMRRKNNRR